MSTQLSTKNKKGLDFGEYLNGLYGYAIVLSRNRAEAEDLVQETCLRALRAIGRLRADGSVKSWLFTILRNIWLNQLRQRRTAPDLVELDADENHASEPADRAQDPLTGFVNSVEREQVRAAKPFSLLVRQSVRVLDCSLQSNSLKAMEAKSASRVKRMRRG